MIRSHILVCGGTGCTSSHSIEVMQALNEELKEHSLQDEDKVRAMDAGANYYFVKPADPAKLLTLIAEHARAI